MKPALFSGLALMFDVPPARQSDTAVVRMLLVFIERPMLIYQMNATIVTYLIVLIQFQQGDPVLRSDTLATASP